MFWRQTATTQQTRIETLLDKSNANLEELLDEDDLIQVKLTAIHGPSRLHPDHVGPLMTSSALSCVLMPIATVQS